MTQPGGLFGGGFGQTPSFGAPAANPAGSTGGFNFGAAAAQPQQQQQTPGFSFGSTATQQPAAQAGTAGGFSFGTAQPAVQATPAPATGGFSFGTAPAQQQTATGGGGFNFGSAAATQPAAGSTGLFGSLASTSAVPTTGIFGTTAPAASGVTGFGTGLTTGFGSAAPAASTANTLTSFGAPAVATSTPATGFGSLGATPALGTATGSLFGTPASQPAVTSAATGFSFGATGFGGGTGTGTTTTTATTPASSAFTLGGTSTTQSTSSAPTLSFGSSALTSAPAPTLNLGGFGGAATTATTSAPAAFSFGTVTSSAAPATSTSTLFSGFGTTTAAAPATTAVTSAVSTLGGGGLGGVPKYSGTGADGSFAFGSGAGKPENRALQELPVPPELVALVEELKNQIKADKIKATELRKANNDILIDKVSQEFEEVKALVSNVASLIHKQSSSCATLKVAIQQGIVDAEMAVQTKETPIASQMEHTTPVRYFFRLLESYKKRMNVFLQEIAKAESSLNYVISAQPNLTAKELYDALKATQESTIVISAKVQILHEELGRVAEANANLKRYVLGDSSEAANKTMATHGDKDQMTPFLSHKAKSADYPKPGMFFQSKIVEPPTFITGNQSFGTPAKQTGGLLTGGLGFTSTPATQPHMRPDLNDSYYGPRHLFQTQQSTLMSLSHLPPNMLSPTALKRSKS